LTPTRILIADDYDVVRVGVRHVLEAEPGWQVCGEARDGRRAVALALVLNPDLVVLGVGMRGLNGIEVTRRLHRLLPNTEIVVLTTRVEDSIVAEAMNAGALGYVLKSDPAHTLVSAVRQALAHQRFISGQLHVDAMHMTAAADASSPRRHLTPREREVLQLVGEGRSNKEIGLLLGISAKTAETHRARLMTKLRVHSVASLVRYAVRHGIVKP
jgi:DNA-binding NarL/FixJ family response regulator